MKKFIYGFVALLIICAISMYCTDDNVKEQSDSDLRIWFPSGYEIMKQTDMNDIAVISEIENKLGISLYYESVSGDIDALFQTQMSDLSDIDMLYYRFTTGQINSGLKNGLLYDYKQDLDQMPNLKKQFELHPELYERACPNDVCVVFPGTKEASFDNLVIAYRSDWAKQAGYESMTSLEELQGMLEKEKQLFQEGQLRNQGKYFIGLSSYRSYINELMKCFQTGSDLYYEQGELVYGASSDEYRAYLTYLQGLFQQELLDPRLYETSETDMEKFFLNSQCGAILTTDAHARELEKFSYANGDDIALSYVSIGKLNPQKSIYQVSDRTYQVLDYGYVIKAGLSEEKRQEALQYIDFLYSEEGMELANYGVEGTHFEQTETGKRYKESITSENSYYPISIASYVKQDLLRIDASSDFAMMEPSMQQQIKESAYEKDHSFIKPIGYYTEKEEELVQNIEISLETFVQETSMNFIFKGIDPMNEEDWNDFLNGLDHVGLQEYLSIQKTAAARSQVRQ